MAASSQSGDVTAEQLTFQEITQLNRRKTELKQGYSEYISKHQDVKSVLNDFMCACLLEKPTNIFEFARQHFSGLQAEFRPQDAGTIVPLVITGPPGVGKKTLISRLQKICPNQFKNPIPTTSREPIPALFEKDGEDAYFISGERLTTDIENGKFFHYEPDESGSITGISYDAVDEVIAKGHIPVLSIPVSSFKLLLASRHYPTMRTIFLRPHEVEALEERLKERGNDTEESITNKLFQAEGDMSFSKTEGVFAKIIVNAVVDNALAELKECTVDWYPHIQAHLVHHTSMTGEKKYANSSNIN